MNLSKKQNGGSVAKYSLDSLGNRLNRNLRSKLKIENVFDFDLVERTYQIISKPLRELELEKNRQ